MLLATAAFDPKFFFHLVLITLHFVFPSIILSNRLQDTNQTAYQQKGNDCKINSTRQQSYGKRQQLDIGKHPCVKSAGHLIKNEIVRKSEKPGN